MTPRVESHEVLFVIPQERPFGLSGVALEAWKRRAPRAYVINPTQAVLNKFHGKSITRSAWGCVGDCLRDLGYEFSHERSAWVLRQQEQSK